MIPIAVRSLPCVIGEQYILTSVVDEGEDTIVYEATQKDLQREVLVESLRLSAMADEGKRRDFIDTCRLQARVRHSSLAAPLELLETESTLHVVRERIMGEPLDMMVTTGRVLSAEMVCSLLQQMCYIYLYFDMERIASRPFSPAHTYLMDFGGFRFDHMAVAGIRRRGDTRRQMSDMVQVVAPLLDRSSAFAAPLLHIMDQINSGSAWSSITPAALDEELIRLQMEMIHRKRQ
ncbi:MAG: hypothetical protein IJE66_07120 [Akkermansia sp.]|nr:hypothetical protein [Akkermansia sp.]